MDEQNASLDAVDRQLLAQLVADGRRSVNALAADAGISRASAYRRLERLQDVGAITGFTARVDHGRVGRPVTVMVNVVVDQPRWHAVQEALAGIDGMSYIAATTGEFDFLALVRLPTVNHLRDVVLEQIHRIPGVVRTTTLFVLSERGATLV